MKCLGCGLGQCRCDARVAWEEAKEHGGAPPPYTERPEIVLSVRPSLCGGTEVVDQDGRVLRGVATLSFEQKGLTERRMNLTIELCADSRFEVTGWRPAR